MSTASTITITGPDGQTLTAAPLSRRLGATVVDGLLSLAVVYLPYLVLLGGAGSLDDLIVAVLLVTVLSLAWGIFVWWLQAQRGYTPGKRAFGLRTQSVETGAPAGWLWILLRGAVPGLLGALTLGAGVLLFAVSILWDPQRRGWHDKIARTVVIEDRQTQLSGTTPATVSVRCSSTTSTTTRATPSAAPTQRLVPSPLLPEPAPTPVVPAPLSAWSDPPPGQSEQAAMDAGSVQESRSAPAPATGLISGVPGFSTTAAPPVAPTLAAREEDDVEHTVMRRPRGIPVVLRFDHGEQLEINGRGLVGRHPAPGSEVASHLVRMPEDSLSVSKTHLEFIPEGAGVRIRDLHSTNGVSILGPEGERPAIPGEWVSVPRGSRVRFGDHTFEVGS